MDPSSSSASGSNGRQKRVLPSRTRRGGPGVGSCDTDIMILEHQKRRFETEAIIPADTPFLLTTNSEVFSSVGGPAESSVTTVTNERYFDRPDVLKAYREQLTIQTPSFVYVADNPSVGGRFRPRGPEDAQVDTSDAAYERRHRKYETFEKRQRLREKEKLKHEQYKLKERIEQLRVMDVSAFLALPASHFSSAPRIPDEYTEDDSSSMLGAHINGGTPAYHEGERRRKEMLDIAIALEERYRVLLPPERLRKLQSQSAASRDHMSPIPVSASVPAAFRHPDSDVPESEREEDYIGGHYDRKQEKLRIKFKFGVSASQSPAPTTASRTSRRSARASLPPVQNPTRRQNSRAYGDSWSPTPTSSPTKFADSSQLTAYTTSEPPSPDVQPQDAEDSGEESGPPVSDAPHSVVGPDLKPEAVEERGSHPPSRARTLPPLTPPQRLSPLPYTRLTPAPEVNPTNLEQEEPTQENTPSKEHLPIPAAHSGDGDLLIDVDKEPLPSLVSSQPKPESPHAGSPYQHAFSSPRLDRMETELPARSPTITRPTEEGSRLLELANAVQAITATPPTKRQKTRHRGLSKSREPSVPLPQPVEEPEQGSTFVSPGLVLTPKEATFSNGEPMARSSSPPILSAGPSVISDAALASVSAAPGKRRYKKKSVPYRSSDTGEQMHTRSLLMIAGIRGGVRQTQRHQTAFGVKVPEEISDMRDFQLPAEFWPEEELMKHYVYYGLEVPEQGILGTVGTEDSKVS